MDKILEALKDILPQDSVAEVSKAIEAMLTEAKEEIKKEFSAKLEEGYEELLEKSKKDEEDAYKGYQEAAAIIEDLRNRLEMQKAEFDTKLNQEYEEAYQMLQAEKAKNETLETELYEQFEEKYNEMKSLIVDKVNEFLVYKSQDIYEQARREIMNDPRLVEHKVALDKIVETVLSTVSDDEYAIAASKKIAEMEKQIEDAKAQSKIVEARNIRLSTENNKLNEQVRQATQIITEGKLAEQKAELNERVEKAEKVQGRGNIVTDDRIISEVTDKPSVTSEPEADRSFVESLDPKYLEEIMKLSGVIKK